MAQDTANVGISDVRFLTSAVIYSYVPIHCGPTSPSDSSSRLVHGHHGWSELGLHYSLGHVDEINQQLPGIPRVDNLAENEEEALGMIRQLDRKSVV